MSIIYETSQADAFVGGGGYKYYMFFNHNIVVHRYSSSELIWHLPVYSRLC